MRRARVRKGMVALVAAVAIGSFAIVVFAQTTWRAVGPRPIAGAQANFGSAIPAARPSPAPA